MKNTISKIFLLVVFLIFGISLNIPSRCMAEQMADGSEVRGVWISTVYNLDWPSQDLYYNIEAQKLSLRDNLNFIQRENLNTVFFQVRSMGDAIYPSSYAPWSKYLTGSLGRNPGYDPLQFALNEAHNRGLEFHAWFNPFRIDSSGRFNKATYMETVPAGSPLKNNPQWILEYGQYHWLDIGDPQVREYVINTILEVVRNYGIDGVHIDDYFYPYPINGIEFPDSTSYQKYGIGYSNKADWRRDNVNKFIKELGSRIKSVKSSVKFGVSPFGIWRNGTEIGGSATKGLSSYDAIYTDSRRWINEEWVDYIVPQIYWQFNNNAAPYQELLNWWSRQVEGKRTQLYIGHAAYKLGNSSNYGVAWADGNEILNQVTNARVAKNVKGDCFFSLKDLKANKVGILEKLRTVYPTKVRTPEMNFAQRNKEGWALINGSWYYYGADGFMKTGWLYVNSTWYYMQENGVMKTGWLYVNGYWYYLAPSGAMQVGWAYVNGVWYYLNPSGDMATGWIYTNGTWYYLSSSGAMKTGWLYVNGYWYYLESSGAMQTGWVYVGGYWYYLYSNGSMAYNTIIDGYRLSSSGAWI